MNSLVDQSTLLDQPTRSWCNNLNVPKPAAGEPTLLTLRRDAHPLPRVRPRAPRPARPSHLPAASRAPRFRDFVEFPSQVNEMWMLWPEVLANYAVHHETGEPLPQHWSTGCRGAAVQRGLQHERVPRCSAARPGVARARRRRRGVDDVAAFEATALAAVGLGSPAFPPRYSSPYFAHIFAGAYSAGYYSYIWSEVLDADTVEWFKENGGLTRENGDRFRAASRHRRSATRSSLPGVPGRDAEIEPLLERRGLD